MHFIIPDSIEHVVAQTGFGRIKKQSYRVAMGQILSDLARLPFTPTRGKTYSDLIQAWMRIDVVSDYAQGTMDARVESLSLTKYCMQPPQRKANFCTVYFDDDDKLCGASITWLESEPKIASASAGVIRDTPSSNRVMTRLVPTFLITNTNSSYTPVDNSLEDSFLPLLNSTAMAELLRGFQTNTNMIDVGKLAELDRKTEVSDSDKSTLQAKRRRFQLIERLFDEKLKNKQIPVIEQHRSHLLELSTNVKNFKDVLGNGIQQATQPFYTRNRTILGLLAVGVLVPLSLLTFGAPVIAIALSIVVNALFIIAPSALFLRTKEAQISAYNSAQQELTQAGTLKNHIDTLFESLCRPLLQQNADGMKDKQVERYMNDVFLGETPVINPPMGPLMTTIPREIVAPEEKTTIASTPTHIEIESKQADSFNSPNP